MSATGRPQITRRAALAGTAILAAPRILRAQPASIKLGLIHPVTGALAFSGSQCRLGGQMAIDDINAAGGIAAMGGAKIEALLGDAQGKPEIATSLVDQMAEAGAVGFTGCFASPLGLAATTAAAKYNIPFAIDSGIVDSLTTRGLKNTFRLFPSLSQIIAGAIPALDAINKGAGSPAKTAVIVHEDGEFGTNTAKQQAAALAAAAAGAEVEEARRAAAAAAARQQQQGGGGEGGEEREEQALPSPASPESASSGEAAANAAADAAAAPAA